MKDEKRPQDRPADTRKRCFQYALRALKLYRFLDEQRDGAGRLLAKQYVRAATSIGANLQEALSGESRADFIHKYGVAQKEAREALYWLELMAESGLVPRSRLDPIIQETNELTAILTTIIVKSKRSKNPRSYGRLIAHAGFAFIPHPSHFILF